MLQTPGSIEDKCIPNKPMMEARRLSRAGQSLSVTIVILTHSSFVPQPPEKDAPGSLSGLMKEYVNVI